MYAHYMCNMRKKANYKFFAGSNRVKKANYINSLQVLTESAGFDIN